MTMTREALLEHYRESRAELLAALEGLDDARLLEATVDGWSVKDHLAHLAFWDDLRADEVMRIAAGHASALRMSSADDEALNTVAYRVRQGLSLAQVRWELAHSRHRLEGAIAAAPPEALDPTRYGEAGLDSGHEGEHARYLRAWRERLAY